MPLPTVEDIQKFCLKNLLSILTFIGVIIGVVLGTILSSTTEDERWKPRQVMYVQFVGDLYLRMLKAMILPLTISAVVTSIGQLDVRMSWKITARSILWFLGTNIIAVIQGAVLVLSFRPGVNHSSSSPNLADHPKITPIDSILDVFRNLFPPNLVQATLRQFRTILIPPPQNKTLPIEDWTISHDFVEDVNILGIITFSIFLGISVRLAAGSGSKAILEIFGVLYYCTMTMIGWVMWMSPLAVLSLVAGRMVQVHNFSKIIEELGLYSITVVIGLILHSTIILPSIFFLITRKSPLKFIGNLSPALITAFGTASSNVTLPIAMECLEQKNKIDKKIIKFSMPISTVMNKDGTALYTVVAVLFIAQVRQVDIGFINVVVICMIVSIACLASAGVPQAGLITMTIVLSVVGLSPENIGLIIAIDWLLDRFRTTVNVLGNCLITAILEHQSQNDLNRSYDIDYTPVPMSDPIELTNYIPQSSTANLNT